MSDKLVIMDKDLILSYILEPNKKIYFVYINDDKNRVYCSEIRFEAMRFSSRINAMRFVDVIKEITDCEFQIEEV